MAETDAVYPTKAAVLMAVAHGATTLTEVQLAVDLSRNRTWFWLNQLREEGWIAWPPGLHGTLHPNFGVVAIRRNP